MIIVRNQIVINDVKTKVFLCMFILVLLAFPIVSNASNYGTPKEFFLFYLILGFGVSGFVYMVSWLLIHYRNKGTPGRMITVIPYLIVTIILSLLIIGEFIMMSIVSGVFGGSLVGCIFSTVVYFLTMGKFKN